MAGASHAISWNFSHGSPQSTLVPPIPQASLVACFKSSLLYSILAFSAPVRLI